MAGPEGELNVAERFINWAVQSRLARIAVAPVAAVGLYAVDSAPSASADNAYNVSFTYSPNNNGEVDFNLGRKDGQTDQSIFLTLKSPDNPNIHQTDHYVGDLKPGYLNYIVTSTNTRCSTVEADVYIGMNNSSDFSQANAQEVGSATGKPCDGSYTTTSPNTPPTPPTPPSSQCSTTLPSGSVIGMAETSDNNGYWIASSTGQVAACGDAPQLGNGLPNTAAIASTPDGKGYWLATQSGQVEAFGDAQDYGSVPAGMHLSKAIIAMATNPATGGYWLLGGDGGVFTYNAPFYGSTGDITLNQPAVGIESTLDGKGYRVVASDGGVFAYGDATFNGSMGGTKLNKPVVGLANDPNTGGYWEDASDGGIFSFNAPFYGSTGAMRLAKPCVGMVATPDGQGYRFVASDGGIFNFGDAKFVGSAAN